MLDTENRIETILKQDEVTIDTEEALNHFKEVIEDPSITSVEHLTQVVGSSQTSLSFKVDCHNRDKLLSKTSETKDKARLGSLMQPQAGAWINIVPNPALGLHLKAAEFRFAILHRLGLPVFREDGICSVFSQYSDKYGSHSVSCGMAGERIARHNQLRDAIFQVAQTANLAPLKETRALLPSTESHPADVLIPRFLSG